jgi:hypothetical protein
MMSNQQFVMATPESFAQMGRSVDGMQAMPLMPTEQGTFSSAADYGSSAETDEGELMTLQPTASEDCSLSGLDLANNNYARQETPSRYHEDSQQEWVTQQASSGMFMPGSQGGYNDSMVFLPKYTYFVPVLTPVPTMDSLPLVSLAGSATTTDSLPNCQQSSGSAESGSGLDDDEEPAHPNQVQNKVTNNCKKLHNKSHKEAAGTGSSSSSGSANEAHQTPTRNENGRNVGVSFEKPQNNTFAAKGRAAIVKSVRGNVVQMTFDSEGCRTVQCALETAEVGEAAELAAELRARVLESIMSPHGNYVIQKICQVLPVVHCGFVLEELRGRVAIVARHRYGCRIVCRLVEHHAAEPDVASLIDELLLEATGLCHHSFGHHVLQCILENGPEHQQQAIVDALCVDLQHNIRSRNASFVIQKAIAHSAAPDLRHLVAGLFSGGPAGLAVLARNRNAPRVAQLLAEVPSNTGMPGMLGALEFRLSSGKSLGSRQGKRLLKGPWMAEGRASAAMAAAHSALIVDKGSRQRRRRGCNNLEVPGSYEGQAGSFERQDRLIGS